MKFSSSKPRGRPPLDPDDPAVDIHVRLPSKHYDEVFQHAKAARLTVPEWIRRQLRGLKNEK